MKKLPRVQSAAKDAAQAAKDINQLQSGAFPVIEAAFKQVVTAESFTENTSGTVLQGYLEVSTPFGTYWLPLYSAPT